MSATNDPVLSITVSTDNAAFGEDGYERGRECARILRQVVYKLEEDWDGYEGFRTLFDVNGNDVGRWKLGPK